jgi:hypothetical protein
VSWPTTHGMAHTSEYTVWENIVQRCTNPKAPNYSRYGGAGVKLGFGSFEEFYNDIGPRPSLAHSVDRKDPAHGYMPGNVRWATASTQELNKDLGLEFPGVTFDKRRGTYFWRYQRLGKVTTRSGYSEPRLAFLAKINHMQVADVQMSRSDHLALLRLEEHTNA